MISIEQIRAGRGLLNWTQKELAKAAGISLRSLNSIESGDVIPRQDTLAEIQKTFEAQHVLFTEDHGVKLRGERLNIEKYEGETCQEILLNDVIEQLRWRGGNVYTNGVNEARYGSLNEKLINKFYKDCWQYKINDYVLTEKNFTSVTAKPSHHKWVSKDILGELAYSRHDDNFDLEADSTTRYYS